MVSTVRQSTSVDLEINMWIGKATGTLAVLNKLVWQNKQLTEKIKLPF